MGWAGDRHPSTTVQEDWIELDDRHWTDLKSYFALQYYSLIGSSMSMHRGSTMRDYNSDSANL
eukprot:8197163-Pyramimonas_sp.AAC.1